MRRRRATPCRLCGYDAPAEPCPHCTQALAAGAEVQRIRPVGAPPAVPLGGPIGGFLSGFLAIPMGLFHLATNSGVKRWLLPPFVLTTLLLVLALGWTFGKLDAWIDGSLPEGPPLDVEWGWAESLTGAWAWVAWLWNLVASGLEWTAANVHGLLTSHALRFFAWFLVGSLVVWYCFSIAYEALAGPFLDEVHGRLEARWFGGDPRSRLHRPNDLPPGTCARTTLVAAGIAVALAGGLWLTPLPWWTCGLFLALPFAVAARRERRYAQWLRWVLGIEARALWASLLASSVAGILLLCALPLYFVPAVGYFLFAGVAGFATSISLLDIAFERRGWQFGQRLRFLGRNLPALTSFGITSGALLALPIVGPVLMVPAASVGGLWLLCRLDKAHLRRGETGAPG